MGTRADKNPLFLPGIELRMSSLYLASIGTELCMTNQYKPFLLHTSPSYQQQKLVLTCGPVNAIFLYGLT
jgi:hypothetical protein